MHEVTAYLLRSHKPGQIYEDISTSMDLGRIACDLVAILYESRGKKTPSTLRAYSAVAKYGGVPMGIFSEAVTWAGELYGLQLMAQRDYAEGAIILTTNIVARLAERIIMPALANRLRERNLELLHEVDAALGNTLEDIISQSQRFRN